MYTPPPNKKEKKKEKKLKMSWVTSLTLEADPSQ